MGDLEQIFTFRDKEWKIILRENNELQLAYKVLPEESSWKSHPVWYSWDADDIANQPEWSSNFDRLNLGTAVFSFIPQVLKCLNTFIKRYGISFFYFETIDPQKGHIYDRLCSRIAEEITGEWTYQSIGDQFFYFRRVE